MQPDRFREQEREELELFGPPHPGEIFRDDILPRLGLSRKSLAAELGVSYATVSRFLNGRKRVSSKLAIALAEISGADILYWLVVQAHHDAWRARIRRSEAGARSSRRRRASPAGTSIFRTPLPELCEID